MILLVHGLWFGPWTLRPLARRLARSGQEVVKFKYHTTRQTLRQNAKALLEFVRELEADELNFVAHSLGGLVTLKALSLAAGAGEPLPPGRVVLLGSPLSGSLVARRARKLPGTRTMLGLSTSGLFRGFDQIDLAHETGMIAGSRSVGLGWLVGTGGKPGDGTVMLEETRSAALADHLVMPVTHSGMILSKAVAEQARQFIATGQFQR